MQVDKYTVTGEQGLRKVFAYFDVSQRSEHRLSFNGRNVWGAVRMMVRTVHTYSTGGAIATQGKLELHIMTNCWVSSLAG